MQSSDNTPRFRNLSVNGTPRFVSTSPFFNDKEHEEHYKSEDGCFMCRQANVYIKPIGMQQERRVERRHPPPLTRAQIEELCEKKHLTKREVRLLLQCYFPEIKNVKYFQLHKYHSCCYDPKHLNLCKNHITALQHEREQHPHHQSHKHGKDDEHFKKYEKESGHQNQVSFVRIKIEPTKGIPTRFLGPTALPEPLADMLIKQVNRFENKKKLPSFNDEPKSALAVHTIRRMHQSYGNGGGRLSEHLATLRSDDEDDEEEDEGNDGNDNDDSDEDGKDVNTPSSNIRGYNGKVMDEARMTYERKIQTREGKEKEKSATNGHQKNQNGDLVVEDIDELTELFVHEPEPPTNRKAPKEPKMKKRKKRTKKRSLAHQKPKLNHWEILALDQSQQQPCKCRHHVRRLEADQVVYDWCRCKDHLHKGLKERRKSIVPPPPPPPATPPPLPPPVTLPPKPKKVRKRTIGINATERTTTELALAYDPTTVDYDVVREVLYYRTASGRLVKPEITNAFGFNNVSSSKSTDPNRFKSLLSKPTDSPMTARSQLQSAEKPTPKTRSSIADSPVFSNQGSLFNGQTLVDIEAASTHDGMNVPKTISEQSEPLATDKEGMYGDVDDESNNDDEEDDTVQFVPPKYVPTPPVTSPVQSPTVPLSMQKSSKPTYMNQQPTPNFERESSILANRRWFDQALGDQNLLSVHDGRYGLIAGTSAEQYHHENQLPENDYVEPYISRNRSNCTIS